MRTLTSFFVTIAVLASLIATSQLQGRRAHASDAAMAAASAEGDHAAIAAIGAYTRCKSRTDGPTDPATCEILGVALADSRGLATDRASRAVQALRKARDE